MLHLFPTAKWGRRPSQHVSALHYTLAVYKPCASDDASTEEHVDDWVGDAVEMRKALNEDRHVVLALSVVVFEKKIDVEQIVDEVRTPAKYERCNSTSHTSRSLAYRAYDR